MAVEAVTGGRTVWVSDNDPGASKILAHRYPDVPNLGDLTAVDWAAVEPVDVITGGFPCQDLSLAGKRRGMAGARSGLWSHMARAIEVHRPSLVVAENVRGLLSAEATSAVEPCPGCVGDGSAFDLRALGAVLADLADIGYDAAWRGITADSVGAPHARFRVFVVAWPSDAQLTGDSADQLGERSGRSARRAARGAGPARRADRTAENADGSACGERGVAAPRQAESGRAWSDVGGRGGAPDADTDRAGLEGVWTGADGPELSGDGGDSAASDTHAEGERRVQRGTEPEGEQRGPDIAQRGDAANWGPYEAAVRRWEHVLGRSAPEPTAVGLRGGSSLSPRFVEWMMGLPVGHVCDVPRLTRNEQLHALGNGVVPQQAEAAIRSLLAAI